MKNYLKSRLPILAIILGIASPMMYALITNNSDYIGYILVGYFGILVVAMIGGLISIDYNEYIDSH